MSIDSVPDGPNSSNEIKSSQEYFDCTIMQLRNVIARLLEKDAAVDGYYIVAIDCLSIVAHRDVLSPNFSKSGLFTLKNWDLKPGMSVLDIGCGSGILAAFAAKISNTNIVASDISTEAVTCARATAELNKLSINVIHSDLFENIPSTFKFDRIVFNHPYWDKEHDLAEPLSVATSDPGYKLLKRFLREAGGYLREDGKIILTFSSMGNADLHKQCISESQFIAEEEIIENGDIERSLFYLGKKPEI